MSIEVKPDTLTDEELLEIINLEPDNTAPFTRFLRSLAARELEHRKLFATATVSTYEPTPTVGRIVNFTLSEQDAEAINQRRKDAFDIKARLEAGTWPLGTQAHVGNTVVAGQVVPAVIVAVWSKTCINAQALLDGNDQFSVLSANQGDEGHQWNWPKMPKLTAVE